MYRAILAFTLTLTPLLAASAQRVRDVPARPALATNADTNDHLAYWEFGRRRIRQSPSDAAAAFYWAARLNPEAPEYHYARRAALMLTDPRRLVRYFSLDLPTLIDPEVLAMDSLLQRARMIDPFYHERLEEELWIEVIKADYADAIRRAGGWFEDAELEQFVRTLANRNPRIAARISYSRGLLPQAAAYLQQAARANRRNALIRAERAKYFYLMGSFDSARAEMQEALVIARRRDADSTRFFYESKAAWEYGLGRIHEQLGNVAAAREAYERTLTEDLSYYPAHVRLGLVHIERGDTAAALQEFGRAVAVKGNEYIPHATIAYFLANTGRLDSAAVHLRRAIEIEPFASQTWLMLASVLQVRGDAAGALEHYRGFIARAPRNDPDLMTARTRAESLSAGRR
jgi:tetratricopeptide (TPR) repeat protein